MSDRTIARLERADPARGFVLSDAAREELLERVVAARDRPEREHRPRERRRRRILLAVGGAAAAGAVAVVALVGGGSRTVDTAAAAALRDTAAVARSQPPSARPGPGQFVYVKVKNVPSLAFGPEPPFQRGIRSKEDYGFSALVPNVQEIWQGAQGGRQRIANRRAVFATSRDRQAWIDAGRPRLPGGDVQVDPLGALEPIDLPTDPDALYARLSREAADRGPDRHAYMFTLVGDTLREWGATPAQRAALFEVAARIPGVELLGRRTDPAGRKGIGFAMRDEHDPYRITLIVDPDTSALLAETTVTLPGNPIPAGTVTSTQTYSSPRVVDAIGERPPARQ